MGRSRISLGIPPGMLAAIDRERGLVPRERWIRAVLQRELDHEPTVIVTAPARTKKEPAKVQVSDVLPDPPWAPPAQQPEPPADPWATVGSGHVHHWVGKLGRQHCGICGEDKP